MRKVKFFIILTFNDLRRGGEFVRDSFKEFLSSFEKL
jgi:hypothetical protein